jgi:hypothetical protein
MSASPVVHVAVVEINLPSNLIEDCESQGIKACLSHVDRCLVGWMDDGAMKECAWIAMLFVK